MKETKLSGLAGSNPLGYLAAIGLQTALDDERHDSRLCWSDDVVPKATIATTDGTDLAEAAMSAIVRLRGCSLFDGNLEGADDLKFSAANIRAFLEGLNGDSIALRLASTLITEGSADRGGKAKPSDLYFTAGQQRFRTIMREILDHVTEDDIAEAVHGPWRYKSTLPTLMWDVTDDANYALAPRNPATEKKLTVPGAEALAILGLSSFTVFTGEDRTLTTATRGSWKRSQFRWPIWRYPAGTGAIRYLVQQIPNFDADTVTAQRRVRGWGVTRVYEAAIRRSEQGGYGSFSPPRVVWSTEVST